MLTVGFAYESQGRGSMTNARAYVAFTSPPMSSVGASASTWRLSSRFHRLLHADRAVATIGIGMVPRAPAGVTFTRQVVPAPSSLDCRRVTGLSH